MFSLYLPRFTNIEPRQYLEYAGLVAFLLILLGIFGAGRFSLDYLMSRKWRELRTAQSRLGSDRGTSMTALPQRH